MSMTFSTNWTEAVYLDANRLNFWLDARSKKALNALAWITAIYFALAIGIRIYDGGPVYFGEVVRYFALAAAVAVAALFICYAIGYALLPRRSRKLFAQQKLHHLQTRYEVTDEAILHENENFSGKLPYALAHKWGENSKVFLIYHSDMTFQILPKADVPKEALDHIRANLVATGCAGRAL